MTFKVQARFITFQHFHLLGKPLIQPERRIRNDGIDNRVAHLMLDRFKGAASVFLHIDDYLVFGRYIQAV